MISSPIVLESGLTSGNGGGCIITRSQVRIEEEDIMNRRTVSVPDWNASMLEIGDDMGVDDDGTRWVVEKVSEAYMTTDGQSWVQITLIEVPVPKSSANDGE
jgi:hypothetical protein